MKRSKKPSRAKHPVPWNNDTNLGNPRDQMPERTTGMPHPSTRSSAEWNQGVYESAKLRGWNTKAQELQNTYSGGLSGYVVEAGKTAQKRAMKAPPKVPSPAVSPTVSSAKDLRPQTSAGTVSRDLNMSPSGPVMSQRPHTTGSAGNLVSPMRMQQAREFLNSQPIRQAFGATVPTAAETWQASASYLTSPNPRGPAVLWSSKKPQDMATMLEHARSQLRSQGSLGLEDRGRATRQVFSGTRETLLSIPSHGVIGAKSTADEVPPVNTYDTERAWSTQTLSRSKKPLAAKIRTDPKRRTPPPSDSASSLTIPVPSFAEEDILHGKGIVFGARTLTAEDIMKKLGYMEVPAPGHAGAVPSFVREARMHSRGVRFTQLSKPWDPEHTEQEHPVGRQGTFMLFETQYPDPNGDDTAHPMVDAPSFTREDLAQNKGVIFGSSRPIPRDPDPVPGPAALPSFVDIDARENRGAMLASRQRTVEEIDFRRGRGAAFTPSPATFHVPTLVPRRNPAEEHAVLVSLIQNDRMLNDEEEPEQ